MPEFLVELYVPPRRVGELDAAAARVRAAAAQLLPAPSAVMHAGSILLTGDETCFWLFEAPTASQLHEVLQLADVEVERLMPAVSHSLPRAAHALQSSQTGE